MSNVNFLAIVVAAASSFCSAVSGNRTVQFTIYGAILGLWR